MQPVHLVCVITDDGEPQIGLAATERAKAVDCVLDAVPEGYAASLVEGRQPSISTRRSSTKSSA